jgi:hypothetical protein
MTGTGGSLIFYFFEEPKLAFINKIKYMIGMNLVQIILCKMGHMTPPKL